jgi:hypothetical protein
MARLSWFVPRPKRRIPPLQVSLIMRVFFVASGNGEAWTGQQAQQDKFSALLDEYGLKKGGELRDKKSGGSRTYRSQLALLGLIFEKDSNGFQYPTQSGLDMLDATVLVKTLQYQLLKLQYPSTYSLNPKEPIDRKFNIRPFVFLLRLAADPDIDGLSDSDICIPIIFGENKQSYDKCKRLILESRLNDLESVIPDDEALKQISKKAQTHIDRLKILKRDIANTFSNYLDSTGLAVRKYVGSASRIFPHPNIFELLNEVDSEPLIKFVGQSDNQADIQFGNRHGAFKDTRRDFKPRLPVLCSISEFIRNRFLSEVGLPTTQTKIKDFADSFAKECKVSHVDVLEALAPVLSNLDFSTADRLLELSKGGHKTDVEFEKSVTRIFELDFGYDESKWTGTIQGKDNQRYMDVFVVETGRSLCGIIDTKSKEKGAYSLPSTDRRKAGEYIDAARHFYGNRILNLSFISYISHQIATGAERQALKIYEDRKIPVSLISVYGLNWMRENPKFQKKSSAVTDYLSRGPVNFIV